jgi:hypothetical protein
LKQGRTQGAGYTELQPLKTQIEEGTDFLNLAFVLSDLPFSRSQPLKSNDDQYIGILKNKVTKFRRSWMKLNQKKKRSSDVAI